jgi:hypothetical protein
MTRAEQAIRLFRVKRSAFYDFPLLGATATASTVSYIELFLSISVSSQGGCVRFLAFGFIREYGSYFFFSKPYLLL